MALPTTVRLVWALWRAHREARIGVMRPIPFYSQNLLFSVASGREQGLRAASTHRASSTSTHSVCPVQMGGHTASVMSPHTERFSIVSIRVVPSPRAVHIQTRHTHFQPLKASDGRRRAFQDCTDQRSAALLVPRFQIQLVGAGIEQSL